MRRIVPLLVVALSLVAGSAHAEAGKKKSTAVAGLLSFGGTFASLAAAGALLSTDDSDPAIVGSLAIVSVGPALGNVYNEEYGRVATTSAIRAGGIVILAYGFGQFIGDLDEHDGDTYDGDLGIAAMLVGGAVWVGSTIYDWVDAPRTAERKNARLTVTPAPLPAKGGPAPGLVLAGSF